MKAVVIVDEEPPSIACHPSDYADTHSAPVAVAGRRVDGATFEVGRAARDKLVGAQ